ncbi:MAG TPA: 30S ribosome-binding factor RbfA, partial [Planctomycetota bacterium]|nr:30S ribosome-binding factor RbfA [Planctomycetota bacterium]
TKVELSRDKRYCTAYISILGKPQEQKKIMKGLESARGFIQMKLGRRLELKHIPSLRLVQDYSIERSIMMEQLMQQAASEYSNNDNIQEEKESAHES